MHQQLVSKVNGVDIVTINQDNNILVPIKPICDALGIDVDAQRNKLNSDEFFNSTTAIITAVAADGKEREMFALPLRYVYGWLATINPGKVAPEARDAVSRYRRECYDVLYSHFAGVSSRQMEQNRAERDLLDQKAAALKVISKAKECIGAANGRIRKVDEQLAKLQSERLNPHPSLFS